MQLYDSSFIVLFTFDGVAILKYITVVHTSLFTMVSRSQLSIDDNKENFTIYTEQLQKGKIRWRQV
jgi:hypothetical protein